MPHTANANDDDFSGKRVTIAGLGHFGGNVAAARWLAARGAKVLVTDKAPAEKLADSVAQLAGLPIDYRLGGHDERDFTAADLVVASPAVPPANPYLAAARAAGVPITTEICLFAERCPAPVVGVTGTKGKSTTSAMLGQILARRFTTWFGGNIGKSLLDDLPNIEPDHVVVLELSSFMLDYLGRIGWSPHVAVVTLLVPDHLDWHGDFGAYSEAKRNILRHQQPGDVAVVNEESAAVMAWVAGRERMAAGALAPSPGTPGEGWGGGLRADGSPGEPPKPRAQRSGAPGSSAGEETRGSAALRPRLGSDPAHQTGASGPHPNPPPGYRGRGQDARAVTYGVAGRTPFDLRVPGRHNQLNAQGAYAAAAVLGVSWDDAHAALAAFTGLPHRLELVHEAGGVRWFNDSIATVPEAAAAALAAFDAGRVIQIVGGSDKGLDVTPMVAALAGRAKAVLCVGQTGPAVAAAVRAAGGRDVRDCGTLDVAVEQARAAAVAGDVVLLSTGFASYGQFTNFQDRGLRFAEFARQG